MTAALALADVDEQLAQLAAQIRDRHQLFEVLARRTVVVACEIGDLLLKAKQHTGHGEWLVWLVAQTPYSADQAERLMRLARNSAIVRNLPDDTSVSRALDLLRAPQIDSASDSAELEAKAAAPGPDGYQVVPMSRAEAEAAVAEIREHMAHVAPVVGADGMQTWLGRVGQAGNGDDITAAFDGLKAELTPERVQTYLEQCLALLEVRDRRGYHQAGCRTFEAYCADRWGFTRDQVADAMGFAEDIVAARAAIGESSPQ